MFSPETLIVRRASALTAAFLGLAVLASCSEEKVEAKQVVRPVKVVEIAQTGEVRRLQFSGAVKSRTEMNLGFRVAGKITERLVNIGDRVNPGDVLSRIDTTDYELAVKTAEANLAAAEKAVETADIVNKRAKSLFKSSVMSKAQAEQAALSYEQAVSVRIAAASTLDQAKNQLDYADLKSDREGIVTAISADTGQVVSAGTPVLTVVTENEKEAEIAVPENDIALFKPGKTVKARFWSDQEVVLDGKVREVSGSADARSRTFSVRVSLPNDPRVLLGMTATVEADVVSPDSGVTIPLSALAKKDGSQIVWTVDRRGETVHSRAVRLADFTDHGVRVAEGLKPGDVVVAAGTQFMTENLKVKLPGDFIAQVAAELLP
ncbi:efflux RND transporter periplasmic adaptor subunit [Rhizobium sp. KVB221]|uniref:Efflux RND transporter periplasmic adaptor subunit n=1 Tax=Rhizobium setariae TaxID=2801340 RepID=A0A937CM04_9HYPH|nr:efflux RND transporter periplasmic adaptor subunit [Rhizobium setariae]MBL0373745.1 efflux RND transporter periplasmic adaptor subunit [Rhizobium setariae]